MSKAGPTCGCIAPRRMPSRPSETNGRPRSFSPSTLAQVEGVGLAGQAAVPGQVSGEREPLGVGEHGLDGNEGR
jgi:hypothetical protein